MKTILPLFFLSIACLLQGQEKSVSHTLGIVDSLIFLNRTLTGEQSFVQALEVIEEAEQLAKTVSQTTYARCLYNHGRTCFYAARPGESVPYFLKALKIQEKDPGKEHQDYAYSLTGLANSYRSLGRLEEAVPMYLESKEIRKKVFGEDHPVYAGALNNLAVIYWDLGDYKKTEPLLLESKLIREKTLGREHPHYASSLDNLAILYNDMGQYEKAEDLYRESIALKEKALGREHPEYGRTLENFANLYFDLKKYEEAESLFLESLSISENAFGKETREYALTLLNLANLYRATGRFEEAETLFTESFGIMERSGNKESLEYAAVLNNLGNLFLTTGNYEKVVPLLEESIRITKRVSGNGDPKYNLFLQSLADAYQLQFSSEDAEKILVESIELQRSRLLNAASFLSEKELTEYTRLFEANVFRIFNFLRFRIENKIPLGDLTNLGYDNMLFYKGYLLTAVRQMNVAATAHPTTSGLYNELKSYRRRLAREYALPIQSRDSLSVIDLEEKANSIEKKLANLLTGYIPPNQQIGWQSVRSQLNPGEAAIEFINFPCNFPQPSDTIMYAALVLTPGTDPIKFVPLFEEKQLEKMIAGNTDKDSGHGITQLYTRGAKPINNGHVEGLYKLIWAPLDSMLGDVKKVFYAPAGLLHRISFDAIAGNDDQLLSDRFQLTRMGSTRALAESETFQFPRGNEIVLFGGINYDDDVSEKDDIPFYRQEHAASTEMSFSFADRGSAQGGERWGYLKGTKEEMEAIVEILNTTDYSPRVFSGSDATEASFKRLDDSEMKPWAIHVATHGFFFPDPEMDAYEKSLSRSEVAFKLSDHPMLRSGLLFAGANETWITGKPQTSKSEDGILTAYEISQMDLSNTKLVVLSACETGLGDIQGNEGVYGLQRGFKIAGVKYIIMSLWKVPDEQTASLMTHFYTNLLQKGMDVPEAFKVAQKEFRETEADPYLWAGFVLLE